MKHHKKNHPSHSSHSHAHSPHHKHHIHHTHGLRKHRMDQKKLTIAIIVVFSLIVLSVAFILLFDREPAAVELQPDPVSEQCAFFCDTNQKNAFCNVRLTAEETSERRVRATCDSMSTESQYAQYGVQSCPGFDCTPVEKDNTCVAGMNSEWTEATSEGNCPAREGKFVLKRNPSDSPPEDGQVCCFYYD